MDSEAARIAALQAAAIVHEGQLPEPGELTSYAGELLPWLTTLPAARLESALAIDGRVIAQSPNGGQIMANAIAGVNTTVTVTALPKDANDNTTADHIDYAVADTAGVLTGAVISPDTHTWTGTLTGVLGTATITGTCREVATVPSYVATVTVTAGATTHIVGTTTVT
jgi:hypothetical protein